MTLNTSYTSPNSIVLSRVSVWIQVLALLSQARVRLRRRFMIFHWIFIGRLRRSSGLVSREVRSYIGLIRLLALPEEGPVCASGHELEKKS